MIYFIDEDVHQLRAYITELEILGYDVTPLQNADIAFSTLIGADDIELVIIDVMLATAEAASSRFDRESTQDFLKTGIVLARDILEQRPELARGRLVLFSMAAQSWLIKDIDHAAKKLNIEAWKKKDYPSPFRFGAAVRKHIIRASTVHVEKEGTEGLTSWEPT